jgi:hypothetical protein
MKKFPLKTLPFAVMAISAALAPSAEATEWGAGTQIVGGFDFAIASRAGREVLIAQWLTYDAYGRPLRLLGIGPVKGNGATMSFYAVSDSFVLASDEYLLPPPSTDEYLLPPPSKEYLLPPPSTDEYLLPPPSTDEYLLPPPSTDEYLLPPPSKEYLLPPPSTDEYLLPPPSTDEYLLPPPSKEYLLPPPSTDEYLLPPPSTDEYLLPPPSKEYLLPPPSTDEYLLPPPSTDEYLLPPPSKEYLLPPPSTDEYLLPPYWGEVSIEFTSCSAASIIAMTADGSGKLNTVLTAASAKSCVNPIDVIRAMPRDGRF